MLWLLVGYMWLFVHRPFEVWPWLGALHVERVYMLVTIAYWTIFAEKHWTSNRLNPAFLLLGTAIVLSNLLSPYAITFDLTVQNWLKIAVFYVLVMSTVTSDQDLRRLVVGFLVCMGLYLGHSFCEFLFGRHEYRMGVVRMVGVSYSLGDPNSFAASVLYALPIALPVWSLSSRQWQRGAVIGYVLLSVVCILLTGSRSAFVGLLSLGMVLSLLSPQRVKIMIALLVILPIAWCSMQENLRNRYITLVDATAGPENAKTSADGRKASFYEGLAMWKRHPLTGVGAGYGWKFNARGLQLHNLYGQVLGELGTTGAIALLAIVIGMLYNAAELRRMGRECNGDPAFLKQLSLAIFLALLLLLLLGWAGHNMYRFTWLWYGAFQAIAVSCLERRCAGPDGTGSLESYSTNESHRHQVMEQVQALTGLEVDR